MDTGNNTRNVEILSDWLITYLRTELGTSAVDYSEQLTQLQGGYETSTYRFGLDGAPEELSKPLVLRLYPQYYGAWNAIWESTVQNVLAEEGYPVARAHLVCTDLETLGGAFFIMDYLPGQLLVTAPPETLPDLLGTAHAELHNIDPTSLLNRLKEQGISEHVYNLDGRFKWLSDKADKLPWIHQGVNWLLENRPPEPEQLSICHGDFHALNILHVDGKISGVLDWPGFAITDPVFDVANSAVLISIPYKHLSASMDGFSTVDWGLFANLYLSAYQAKRPLDETNLDYYQVRRCVAALVQGAEGQEIWQHPLIVRDLLSIILDITGIRITMPA